MGLICSLRVRRSRQAISSSDLEGGWFTIDRSAKSTRPQDQSRNKSTGKNQDENSYTRGSQTKPKTPGQKTKWDRMDTDQTASTAHQKRHSNKRHALLRLEPPGRGDSNRLDTPAFIRTTNGKTTCWKPHFGVAQEIRGCEKTVSRKTANVFGSFYPDESFCCAQGFTFPASARPRPRKRKAFHSPTMENAKCLGQIQKTSSSLITRYNYHHHHHHQQSPRLYSRHPRDGG